jgi:hypothetical protein
MAIGIMAILIIPVAVMMHTVVWIFYSPPTHVAIWALLCGRRGL